MPLDRLQRRDFITLLGGAATWPLAARAQQPVMPVVGYLYSGSADANPHFVTAFLQGLGQTGYIEGRNFAIEYRWAEGKYDRLPELAADLIRHPVTVIVAPGNLASALAAKAATTTIPIVFAIGGDPVKLGLVASMNRPGSNATGVTMYHSELGAKRLGFLKEVGRGAALVAVLMNPTNLEHDVDLKEIQEAARTIGQRIQVLSASTSREIGAAFATLAEKRAEALLTMQDTFFNNRRVQIVTLAARHALPAIYVARDWSVAGGLMSYGTRTADVWRQVGVYTGRILSGAKPAELPVEQPTKFELVINLQTATALALDISPNLLALADEVIE
jgi:putative tryptophan/tyrosine transport system substrate-binding protein